MSARLAKTASQHTPPHSIGNVDNKCTVADGGTWRAKFTETYEKNRVERRETSGILPRLATVVEAVRRDMVSAIKFADASDEARIRRADEKKARRAQRTRQLARQTEKRKAEKEKAKLDPELAARIEERESIADLMRCRALSRAGAVKSRLEHGYRWGGGEISGEMQEAFVYKGLRSSDHPLLKMFPATLPRAAKGLRSGMNKVFLEGTDSKLIALDELYIEGLKSVRRWIRVDLDAIFSSWGHLRMLLEDLDIPLPHMAVGLVRRNGEVVRPHLIFYLRDGIRFDNAAFKKPQALYKGVMRGLYKALGPLGADPGGIWNPMRVKNPLSPHWGVAILNDHGMAVQFDRHVVAARDGMSQRHAHGLATTREFAEDGFGRKRRDWNAVFRAGQRKGFRQLVAQRLTEFCAAHGIAYQHDGKANSTAGLPPPEPAVPDWNWEAERKTGKPTPSLVALDAHRARRREWEDARDELAAAEAEVRSFAQARTQRLPGIAAADPDRRRRDRADRKAAVLAAWHKRPWIDADEARRIENVRFDEARNCVWLNLKDRSALLDTGEAVFLRGALTWDAALETAATAKRHGWGSVVISGSQEYRELIATALAAEGILVQNHTLSSAGQEEVRGLRAARTATAVRESASDFERLQHARRLAALAEPEPKARASFAPKLVPPWVKPPKPPEGKGEKG